MKNLISLLFIVSAQFSYSAEPKNPPILFEKPFVLPEGTTQKDRFLLEELTEILMQTYQKETETGCLTKKHLQFYDSNRSVGSFTAIGVGPDRNIHGKIRRLLSTRWKLESSLEQSESIARKFRHIIEITFYNELIPHLFTGQEKFLDLSSWERYFGFASLHPEIKKYLHTEIMAFIQFLKGEFFEVKRFIDEEVNLNSKTTLFGTQAPKERVYSDYVQEYFTYFYSHKASDSASSLRIRTP